MALESGNGRSSGKCLLTSNDHHLHLRQCCPHLISFCDVSKNVIVVVGWSAQGHIIKVPSVLFAFFIPSVKTQWKNHIFLETKYQPTTTIIFFWNIAKIHQVGAACTVLSADDGRWMSTGICRSNGRYLIRAPSGGKYFLWATWNKKNLIEIPPYL
jgi:hypothetical protein